MACCPLRALIQRRRRVVPEGHDDSSPALQCWVCIKKDDPSRKGRSNTTFSHKRSIVPSRDGYVLSSLFPAINCRATFNSPLGVCWTLLGENALGFSGEAVISRSFGINKARQAPEGRCSFGALCARTPISRSGLVLESMHEYPRFLRRYSRQADSSSGEQHGTHPESHLLRAYPVQ
jgi:hypothetical protein